MKLHPAFVVLAATFLVGCSDKEGQSPAPSTQVPAAQVAPDSNGPTQATSAPVLTDNTGGANSAVASPSPSAAPPSAYLPAESKLLAEGGLATERAVALLQSDKQFQQAARAFDQGAANSLEAQDLAAHYKAAVARGLSNKEVLRDFSCGLSLCIGSIRTKSADDYTAWSERFAKDTGAPTYSFMETTKKLSEGEYESRFVFSTDPGANSMTAPGKSR
ncbi:hypothetical protein [Lysobacter sp. CA196]|uniref:hypothetical protein n=1 Tax=Lysobacter sp. CA196 TaxID=3455606 RepID=UPI003F8CF7F6